MAAMLPDSSFYRADVHGLFMDMVDDYHASGPNGVFGYENITDAALLTGGNAATHMWLDPVHPTSKTQVFIGDFVGLAIPEPASGWLWIMSGLVLAGRGRILYCKGSDFAHGARIVFQGSSRDLERPSLTSGSSGMMWR